MKLFLADRASTRFILEPIDAQYEPQPYTGEVQFLFEVCRVMSPVTNEMGLFPLIEAFLTSLGLDECNETCQEKLHEVDQVEASNILTYLLSYSLAYGLRTTTSEKQITHFLERLFSLFSSHPRYFTNGEFDFGQQRFPLQSLWPLTRHTFDTGLLLVDDQRIGIVWDMDED